MSQHDVRVDVSGQDRDLAKAYKRMASAGKSDKPRNCWSSAYRSNWQRIFRPLHANNRT